MVGTFLQWLLQLWGKILFFFFFLLWGGSTSILGFPFIARTRDFYLFQGSPMFLCTAYWQNYHLFMQTWRWWPVTGCSPFCFPKAMVSYSFCKPNENLKLPLKKGWLHLDIAMAPAIYIFKFLGPRHKTDRAFCSIKFILSAASELLAEQRAWSCCKAASHCLVRASHAAHREPHGMLWQRAGFVICSAHLHVHLTLYCSLHLVLKTASFLSIRKICVPIPTEKVQCRRLPWNKTPPHPQVTSYSCFIWDCALLPAF